MRLLGTLPTESEANHLTAWLLTQSIECHVEQDGTNGFDVWVKDEDGFASARTEFADFQKDPKAEKYRNAVAAARRIKEEELARQKQFQKNVRTNHQSEKGIFEAAP